MLILLCLIMFAYLVYKTSLNNVYVFSCFGLLLYYYPILAFDNLIIYNYSLSVDMYSRIIILINFLLIFLFGLFYSRNKNKYLFKKKQYSIEKKYIYFSRLSFLVALLFSIHFLISGGIKTSKVESMLNLGYAYKAFQALSIVSFSSACMTNQKKLILCSLIFVITDITYGFRYLIFFFIFEYIFIVSINLNFRRYLQSLKNKIKFLFFVLFFVFLSLLIIFLKLSEYDISQNSWVLVMVKIEKLMAENAEYFIGSINPESTSISIVFNEIIKYDFRISMLYLYDSMVSLIPFLPFIVDYTPSSFDAYYKGYLLFSEADSFASSALGIGYTLFGWPGIFGETIIQITLLQFIFNKYLKSNNIFIKVPLCYCIILLSIYAHRSDYIYNISLIRSVVLVTICMFLIVFFLMKVNSQSQKICLNND